MNYKALMTSAVFALGVGGLSATAMADHEGKAGGEFDERVDKSAVIELFRTLDRDKDGRLDREEAGRNDNVRDQFRQLDFDDDDLITIGEFMHVEFEETLK